MVSKLVPVIVTVVPGAPIVGVKFVIVGAPEAADVTVNALLLVIEPTGQLTPIGPVVAPAGTMVTSCVRVAEITVAPTPLKVTVF